MINLKMSHLRKNALNLSEWLDDIIRHYRLYLCRPGVQ